MKETDITVASLNKQIDDSRYRLETLGAGPRLAERDKLAVLERRLRALVDPQPDPAIAEATQGA
jgi:hypothetical protein